MFHDFMSACQELVPETIPVKKIILTLIWFSTVMELPVFEVQE
jgi:hypothetical protein